MIEAIAALKKRFQNLLERITEHFICNVTKCMSSDIEVLYPSMKQKYLLFRHHEISSVFINI